MIHKQKWTLLPWSLPRMFSTSPCLTNLPAAMPCLQGRPVAQATCHISITFVLGHIKHDQPVLTAFMERADQVGQQPSAVWGLGRHRGRRQQLPWGAQQGDISLFS